MSGILCFVSLIIGLILEIISNCGFWKVLVEMIIFFFVLRVYLNSLKGLFFIIILVVCFFLLKIIFFVCVVM